MRLPAIHHVGLVVADLEEAMARQARELGVGPFWIDADASLPVVRRGQPQTLRLAMAMVQLGGVLVELIQPLDDLSPHAEALATTGEGLHHLGYLVDSIPATLDGLAAAWSIRSAVDPDRHVWGYLQASGGGLAVELVERAPSSVALFAEIDRVTGRG